MPHSSQGWWRGDVTMALPRPNIQVRNEKQKRQDISRQCVRSRVDNAMINSMIRLLTANREWKHASTHQNTTNSLLPPGMEFQMKSDAKFTQIGPMFGELGKSKDSAGMLLCFWWDAKGMQRNWYGHVTGMSPERLHDLFSGVHGLLPELYLNFIGFAGILPDLCSS